MREFIALCIYTFGYILGIITSVLLFVIGLYDLWNLKILKGIIEIVLSPSGYVVFLIFFFIALRVRLDNFKN